MSVYCHGRHNPRMATRGVRKLFSADDLVMGLGIGHHGLSLRRKLSYLERLTWSLLACGQPPTHHLTWAGRTAGSREDLCRSWERARKRIGRERGKSPLYMASVVKAEGAEHWHLHVLLWGYVHVPALLGMAPDLHLGRPQINRIPSPQADLVGAATMIAYVLGQNEAVFGNGAHHRHAERVLGKHRLIKPKLSTFQRRAPAIFAALEAANSSEITDRELGLRLPSFTNKDSRTVRRTEEALDLPDPLDTEKPHAREVAKATRPDRT